MQTLLLVAAAWRWSVPGLSCCAALLVLYAFAIGFRPSSRLAWFLAGDALLAIAVCSPLDLLARQYLFTAEVLEQILIGFIATYLLVLGVPERAVRHLRLDGLKISYYVAWVIGMAVLTIWYFPGFLSAALANNSIRGLELVTLLAGGAVFWWPLHSPLRAQRIPLVPNALFYLVAATVWCSLLGLFLAFGPSRLASYYAGSIDTLHISDSLIGDWGLTRETDQETAGLLLWISGAGIMLTEVMLVYYRWYISQGAQNERSSAEVGARPPSRPDRG